MSKTTGNSKRARCSNFSAFEEITLVDLAVKHSSVLECKKSDHDVWEAKNTSWKQIQANFVAATGNNRDVQNLKDKYENLKRKTKKIEGDRKKQIFQTGGGARASCSVAPDTHNTLLGILGVSAVGLSNPFDGDKPGEPLIKSLTEEDIVVVGYDETNNCDVTDYLIDVHLESDVEDNMDISIVASNAKPTSSSTSTLEINSAPVVPTWSKWTPETLKSQKSAELTSPLTIKKNNKTTLGESVKKYSQDKAELISKQKMYFENEERRAQEKHDADQLRNKEKHEWERVHHELRIEKLRHEINDLKKRKYRLHLRVN